jgi:hypothetical protein
MRLSSSSSSHPHSSLTPNPPPPHIHFSRSQFPQQHPSYFGGGGGWVGSEEGQKVGRSRGWSIPVPPPASPQPTSPPPPLSISMTTVRGHKRLRAYRSLSQPYTMYICMYTSRVCVCVRARARALARSRMHTHTHTHTHTQVQSGGRRCKPPAPERRLREKRLAWYARADTPTSTPGAPFILQTAGGCVLALAWQKASNKLVP